MIAPLIILGVLLVWLQYALIALLAWANLAAIAADGLDYWNVFWLVVAAAFAANPIKVEVKA